MHLCSNNTIYGTEWKYVPETNGVPIIADMSSNILSKPIEFLNMVCLCMSTKKIWGCWSRGSHY